MSPRLIISTKGNELPWTSSAVGLSVGPSASSIAPVALSSGEREYIIVAIDDVSSRNSPQARMRRDLMMVECDDS